MSVLLVTFTVNGPQQDVGAVHAFIRSHQWARLAENTFAIETKDKPFEVYDRLVGLMGTNEGLFVFRLCEDWWGFSPHADVAMWLRVHLG